MDSLALQNFYKPSFDLAKVAQMIEKAKADDYYTGNISFEDK